VEAAPDAGMKGLWGLLAEVKSNRNELRQDRDEWRGRAERLLTDQRRPWWPRRASGLGGERRSAPPHRARSLMVIAVVMMAPRFAMATDIGRAGSRPFLAFIEVVPRPVESRRRRRAVADAISGLRDGRDRREGENGAKADQGDCLELVLNMVFFPGGRIFDPVGVVASWAPIGAPS
jgi:hypothetical protein